MYSTFGSFTTAHLALRASQQGLNVTGQNISNINTTGYTRQALDQISLNFSSNGRYAVSPQIGHGTLVKNITQIRDPYLDLRFRNEITQVGEADTKLSVLKELEGIFDEVVKGDLANVTTDGLLAQISDLTSMIQKFSTNVTSKEFESMVKSSADHVTKLFNQYAKQIEQVKADLKDSIENVDVPNINNILENIAEINKSIKIGQVNGNPSLELLDQRNMLLDELASYVKVDISYVPTKLSESLTIDELKIEFVGSDGSKTEILNHDKAYEFKFPTDGDLSKLGIYSKISEYKTLDKVNSSDNGNGTYTVYDADGDIITDNAVIGDNNYICYSDGNPIPFVERTIIFDSGNNINIFESGSLKGSLEMYNYSGEFDANKTIKGIGYFEKMMDTMAATFAKTLNDLNNINTNDDSLNLFSSSNGAAITAKNITLAAGWENGDYGITASKIEDPLNPPSSGAQDNILRMINALNDKNISYLSSDGKEMFKGSFHEFYANVSSTLGIEVKSVTQTLNNHAQLANEIADAKDSISGVHLDDEGINLLKFQKSYTAAARLMTTLDEALDTLINKMGVVGR